MSGRTAASACLPTADEVWVLNLDSDLELLDPAGFRRSTRQLAESRRQAARLVQTMTAAFGAAPVVLEPACVDGARALPGSPAAGAAWCPTPSALRCLEQAGAHSRAPAVPAEVLAAVNHREFAARLALPGDFPRAAFCRDLDSCHAVWCDAETQPFLLKRPFGFSGRQRKVVVPADLDAAARTWIRSSFERAHGGGLMVEPFVSRSLDCGLHGMLAADGSWLLGEPTLQVIGQHGEWVGSRLATEGELEPTERDALRVAAERCAVALRDAGYRGPFGVDAFRWVDSGSAVPQFRALCELNARYSMGWFVGMARYLG